MGQKCLETRCTSSIQGAPRCAAVEVPPNRCRAARHIVAKHIRKLTKRAGYPLSQVSDCTNTVVPSNRDRDGLKRECTQKQYGTNLSGRAAYNAVNRAAPGRNPTN
jgi:hypothetical protein